MQEEINKVNLIEQKWNILPKWAKISLSVLGTILIGSFSTPVWNYLIKPLLLLITNVFFNIVFYVSQAMEKMVYIDIAQSDITFDILLIKTFIFMIIIGLSIGTLILKNLKGELEDSKSNDDFVQKVGKNIKHLNNIEKLFTVPIIISIILLASFIIEDTYVTEKQQSFRYKLSICEPYLKVNELQLIKSKFALISSKKDYNLLITKLDSILITNKIVIPSDTLKGINIFR